MSGSVPGKLGPVTNAASDPSQPAIYKVNRENAKAMIGKALDAGINLFDTPDLGGQSEVMLGELLGERRLDVMIASKVDFRANPNSFIVIRAGDDFAAYVRIPCEVSLAPTLLPMREGINKRSTTLK